MLQIVDQLLPGDTSDAIADVNCTAFTQAHGDLLSPSALARCTQDAFRENWAKYPNPRNVYGFAYRNEVLVGFTVLGQCRHAGLEHHGELYALYVDPSAQHRGIGSALLQYGVEKMYHRSNGKIFVAVVTKNVARNFYLSTGAEFVLSQQRDIFGDMLKVDVLCYNLTNDL